MTKHALLLLLIGIISIDHVAGLRRDPPEWLYPAAPTRGAERNGALYQQSPPVPTTAPDAAEFELRRRETEVGINTCGFWTDDHSAFACNDGITCTNIGDYRGCCAGSDCTSSSFSTTCYDATATECSSYSEGTLCCTDEAQYPYCVTYLWATSATPTKVFTMYWCDIKTFAGQQVLAAEPFPTSSAVSTDSSSSATTSASADSSSTASTTGPAGATSPATSSGSSTNVGAIAGGVVGGLAVVGLVVLGVFFMFFRSKKTGGKSEASHSEPESPPAHPPPPTYYTGSTPGSPPMGGYPSPEQAHVANLYAVAETKNPVNAHGREQPAARPLSEAPAENWTSEAPAENWRRAELA